MSQTSLKDSSTVEFCYMPILKWKQGEQMMLKKLSDVDKDKLLPLVELIPPKVPFTSNLPAELSRYLNKTANHLIAADFDKHFVAIDTLLLHPSYANQAKLLVASVKLLYKQGTNVMPVIHPAMLLSDPTEIAKLNIFDDVLLRILTEAILPEQIPDLLNLLKSTLSKADISVHVLLDRFSMVSTNPNNEAATVSSYIKAALTSSHCSSLTFAGGAFPISLAGIPQGHSSIARHDIQTYKILHAGGFPKLRFGDYTVSSPIPLEELDPTKMNPSAQIRYALDDEWMILKAGGSKTYGMGQYNALSKILVAHKYYSGNTFSFGDERYFYHAQPGSTSGSYMTWRRDATSHHVVYTVRQLRKLHGI